jgi:Uncharacterised protein family (UPF0236)
VRPFKQAAQVECRSFSLGLQRVAVDFAADSTFEEAVEKVKEHYGIEVCAGTVRSLTEGHGQALREAAEVVTEMPQQGVKQVIAEMDGSLVPCVEIFAGEGDKRNRREVCWREAKLSMVRVSGTAEGRYAATMGGTGQAGEQWRRVAVEAGVGRNTRLHCLGDGAKWIVSQAQEQFGSQATYLLDLYHVSEYLAEAGAVIAGAQATQWMKEQQERLKENRAAEVLAELAAHREVEGVAEAAAPVRRCERYLTERLEYLDYKSAIAAGLPIGSGEIEGSHRSVVQARLKKSGAWWCEENADKMLALRVCRANGEWKAYWQQQRQAHA